MRNPQYMIRSPPGIQVAAVQPISCGLALCMDDMTQTKSLTPEELRAVADSVMHAESRETVEHREQRRLALSRLVVSNP